MELDNTELNIKKVLIIIGAVGIAVAWFYQQVVIPINNIQASIASIQVILTDNKQFQSDTNTHLQTLDKQVTTINQKLNISQ